MSIRKNMQLVTLKKRDEFVKLRAGKRIHTQGFILQANHFGSQEKVMPRFGFTVTKKTGNSVVRNRIRRRLREIVRIHLANCEGLNGDFVLIGKIAALHVNFDMLLSDLVKALDQRPKVRANPQSITSTK